MGREEARRYGVEIRDVEVIRVRRAGGGFEADLGDGARVRARRVVIATGMADNMPAIEGLPELYGSSVFHCPYCDGWEVRDQPLAVIARGHAGFRYALLLTPWSRDIVLCTHGPSELTPDEMAKLTRHAIPVRQEPIAALVGREGQLERVVFESGESLPRVAAFVKWGERPQSSLAQELGCRFTEDGTVKADAHGCASVEGVYVVGDASPAVQLVIVAAAQGASAATHIQSALLSEDRGLD
jgi:thioredoxin reductase